MINHFEMELTQRQAQKYLRATKKEKGEIIDKYCEIVGVSRNLAAKRFRQVGTNLHPRILKDKIVSNQKKGANLKYTILHRAVIKKVWELSGYICGERLHGQIDVYIEQLGKNDKLKYFGKRYIEESKGISEATLKRMITKFPKLRKKRSVRGKSDLYKAIPIKVYFGENVSKTGYVEIDYVEHNGGNSAGLFAITGTYVDVCLQWTVRAAGLGKNLRSVTKIHDCNEGKFLHEVKEYHPDNAKPILKLLLGRITNPKSKASYKLSRSRPYHKEDNGHVEQKNFDKVRKLVGYHRYETMEEVELMNELYEIEDLIGNYFVPSQKLREKKRDKNGRTTKKVFEKAKTPYQRLMESNVDEEVKRKSTNIYRSLNLVALREESEVKKRQLLDVISRKGIMI